MKINYVSNLNINVEFNDLDWVKEIKLQRVMMFLFLLHIKL